HNPCAARPPQPSLLPRNERRRRRAARRHHLVAHLVGAPLLQQHRRPAYGTDYEPARDVTRYALPYTGLYQGVGEERYVGGSRAVEGRRRVEEPLWQLLHFAYVTEDIHDHGQRRSACLVR